MRSQRIEEDLADIPKRRVSRACSRNPARSSVQSVVAQEQKAQPRRYTVTDLGPANGATPGQPFAIQNNGLISEAAAVSDAANSRKTRS
jgi:hypothetical protein